MKFRSKPVVVDAILWTGENYDLIVQFCPTALIGQDSEGVAIRIPTLEGTMVARVGDWIIKGTVGEFYPVHPDVFDERYEPVTGDDDGA